MKNLVIAGFRKTVFDMMINFVYKFLLNGRISSQEIECPGQSNRCGFMPCNKKSQHFIADLFISHTFSRVFVAGFHQHCKQIVIRVVVPFAVCLDKSPDYLVKFVFLSKKLPYNWQLYFIYKTKHIKGILDDPVHGLKCFIQYFSHLD